MLHNYRNGAWVTDAPRMLPYTIPKPSQRFAGIPRTVPDILRGNEYSLALTAHKYSEAHTIYPGELCLTPPQVLNDYWAPNPPYCSSEWNFKLTTHTPCRNIYMVMPYIIDDMRNMPPTNNRGPVPSFGFINISTDNGAEPALTVYLGENQTKVSIGGNVTDDTQITGLKTDLLLQYRQYTPSERLLSESIGYGGNSALNAQDYHRYLSYDSDYGALYNCWAQQPTMAGLVRWITIPLWMLCPFFDTDRILPPGLPIRAIQSGLKWNPTINSYGSMITRYIIAHDANIVGSGRPPILCMMEVFGRKYDPTVWIRAEQILSQSGLIIDAYTIRLLDYDCTYDPTSAQPSIWNEFNQRINLATLGISSLPNILEFGFVKQAGAAWINTSEVVQCPREIATQLFIIYDMEITYGANRLTLAQDKFTQPFSPRPTTVTNFPYALPTAYDFRASSKSLVTNKLRKLDAPLPIWINSQSSYGTKGLGYMVDLTSIAATNRVRDTQSTQQPVDLIIKLRYMPRYTGIITDLPYGAQICLGLHTPTQFKITRGLDVYKSEANSSVIY